MDPIDNSPAVAQELISLARRQGTDLEPFCTDGHFHKDLRWIFLWCKDEFPWSGRADEPLGTLHYNMQGRISALPSCLKESASAFQGVWSEAGTFKDMEQALELVKAWVLDRKEVDELPRRSVRRYQI